MVTLSVLVWAYPSEMKTNDSDIMEILSLLSLFAPKISSVLEAFALILSLCPLHEFSLACANEYAMFRLILPGIVMI